MEENNPSTNTDNQTSGPSSSPPTGGDVFHPDSTPAAPPAVSSAPDSGTVDQKSGVLGAEPGKSPKKKSKKGLLITLIVLVLAALGVGAWWMTRDKEPVSSTTTTKDTVDIDVLKIGTTSGPASVYFPDEGVNGVQNIMDRQLYEGLVGLENNKIVPMIAQSWTNPDEKTWVFKIRPNIKFHTGKPVTAKEVKASLDGLKEYDYWSLFVSTIESTEATGELELTVKTAQPDALLLNRLVLAYITDLSAADKAGNNGTGAYQVDKTAENSEKSTTLVAFDDHYAGHVKTRKLVYVIYESDALVSEALKKKEVDVMETVPDADVDKDLKAAGFGELKFESPGIFGLYMNQKRSKTTVLNNKDVRTAIAQAMNRPGLLEKTKSTNSPATQVIPKSLPGYDESVNFPAFDLTAAKASLAKSGYKNEQLEFVYISEIQVDAPVLIEQLKALGLNIKETAFTPDETDAALEQLRAGDFDLFTAGFTSDISDARDLLGALLSSTESTYPLYEDATYDKLLADSDKAFDPTERIKLLQQANKYIADNVAWIPLRNSAYVAYFAKNLDIQNEFNGSGSVGAYYRKVGRIVE